MHPDVVGDDRPPSARGRAVVAAGLLVLVTGLVVADRISASRERQRSAERASLRLVVTGAVPTGTGRPGAPVRDVRVDLTVRNDGPSVVRVLEQRLDGGVPIDPGPATAVGAGATAVLGVRWRVRCAEVGGRFGPQSLDLVVRTRSGEVERTRVSLGEPLGDLRRTFRRTAADACAQDAA